MTSTAGSESPRQRLRQHRGRRLQECEAERDSVDAAQLLSASLQVPLHKALSGRVAVHEVVKTIELDAIPVSDGDDSIRLRIEVLKDLSRSDCYRARLLRWDTYSVLLSFGDRSPTDTAD